MTHVAIDIADAVVKALNEAPAETFTSDIVDDGDDGKLVRSFTAVRYYLPVFTLEDMKTLHVSVVPKSVAEQIDTRNTTQGEYQVDIAVQKQADPSDLAEIDSLAAFVQEIADFFRFKRLENYESALWVATLNQPIYSAEHLEKMHQFTSVLTLTFQVER